MSNIWREQMIQNKDFSKDTNLLTNIKIRLHDISSQTIIKNLNENTGKLAFLGQLKKTHNFEHYLNIDNFEHRRAITKIRTSSHKLQIETGRWNRIEREHRICENCALNKIEDEIHFLIECPMHWDCRREFINTIKSKNYTPLSQCAENMKQILLSEDLGILNAVGKFIKTSFQKRENTTLLSMPPNYYIYYTTR